MKILWIVNMLMPELANHLGINTSASGTWMIDIAKEISFRRDIHLGIACIYGDKFRKIHLNNIEYYLLPGNGKNMLMYTKQYENTWKKVYDTFNPDIVHLHGTEYSHGLSFLRSYPSVKSVVSIQGILNRIKDVDFGGLTKLEAIRFRTTKENIYFNGMLEMHLIHKKNARYETEILNKVEYANCVNSWDSSIVKSINPNIQCFQIDYNLRDEFYSAPKWDAQKINRYTVFTNPGGVPLKGTHMLIKALALVKKKFPNVKLIVPGMGNNEGKLIINSGYSKYINCLVNKLRLIENITFLGRQSGKEMLENMLKAHVVVVPSAIEGTSLILREAMFLGVPSIASFRGGMADFIRDKESGFLYDFQEYPYLASRILELFRDDDLALKFSQKAIEQAEKAHDREKNPNEYINMYEFINEH